MPSYIEELSADSARLQRAYEGLIREQEAVVSRLNHDLQEITLVVDRAALRLHIYTTQYGRGAPDTVASQHEAEDANTRMVELRRKLERQQALLNLYQGRLREAQGSGQAPSLSA
jgi:uncharacterized coiled-coil protein SlyX